jgi:hypothetical protein
MIALHFDDYVEARCRIARALALNPAFHPLYADEARRAFASEAL